ncbi:MULTISPECIES: hypothetical protein [Rhizobium/Agrobacterium group]|uniref:GTP cyclohydrolase II domain-containing protein n=1 Tax=Agrobacterium tumefaciens TaxID=358 RepID=A0A2Z2PUE8_AGRTU|nr:hypothetical protein [Agrobacterium radiobacter]ASK45105.1 hypothetical protein [Agrobacterium radiobacter]NTH23297.1 hypothetical protein [Rhizobium rhizogenes]NTH36335.1 hypothetical protein [Rhizobium rhizogenes]
MPAKSHPESLYSVTEIVRDVEITNSIGTFRAACICVKCKNETTEHLAFYKVIGSPLTLRIQSGCVLGHVFGDNECDCKVQLDKSLRYIHARNEGMVIYTPSHDARGRGIYSKLQIYRTRQERRIDSATACRETGVPFDTRDFSQFSSILGVFDVKSVALLGRSEAKAEALSGAGISVVSSVPL